MEKWPLGVFASIDAGLGVHLEVVKELGVPTIHLHAPSKESRTPEKAEEFTAKLKEMGITISVVFSGLRARATPTFPRLRRPWALFLRKPELRVRPS